CSEIRGERSRCHRPVGEARYLQRSSTQECFHLGGLIGGPERTRRGRSSRGHAPNPKRVHACRCVCLCARTQPRSWGLPGWTSPIGKGKTNWGPESIRSPTLSGRSLVTRCRVGVPCSI